MTPAGTPRPHLPLGETFALRFEARGYATLFNSSGRLFCQGGLLLISYLYDYWTLNEQIDEVNRERGTR